MPLLRCRVPFRQCESALADECRTHPRAFGEDLEGPILLRGGGACALRLNGCDEPERSAGLFSLDQAICQLGSLPVCMPRPQLFSRAPERNNACYAARLARPGRRAWPHLP